jgi:hypothetical protein
MHQVADRVFHTPGVYYRPANLKSLTVLMGNTEARTVYRNFDLQNLHINSADPTHALYQRYCPTIILFHQTNLNILLTHRPACWPPMNHPE